MVSLAQRVAELEEIVAGLQRQISSLQSGSPLAEGACRKGNDPESCPSASTYQYQHGCKGASCRAVNTTYYGTRRASRAVVDTPVAAPRRKKTMKRAR